MELAQIMPSFLAVGFGITLLIVAIPIIYIEISGYFELRAWRKEMKIK